MAPAVSQPPDQSPITKYGSFWCLVPTICHLSGRHVVMAPERAYPECTRPLSLLLVWIAVFLVDQDYRSCRQCNFVPEAYRYFHLTLSAAAGLGLRSLPSFPESSHRSPRPSLSVHVCTSLRHYVAGSFNLRKIVHPQRMEARLLCQQLGNATETTSLLNRIACRQHITTTHTAGRKRAKAPRYRPCR